MEQKAYRGKLWQVVGMEQSSKEQRSRIKEVLEQIKKSSDMLQCLLDAPRVSREGYKEAHWDKGDISEWTFNKVTESCDKVASEDSGRLSIAQDIVCKSTGFFRRIIALASGVGGVTSSYRTVIVFRLRIASGGSLQGMEGSSVAGGAQHAAANTIGERQQDTANAG